MNLYWVDYDLFTKITAFPLSKLNEIWKILNFSCLIKLDFGLNHNSSKTLFMMKKIF